MSRMAFDWLLIGQTRTEGLSLVTKDRTIAQYEGGRFMLTAFSLTLRPVTLP